MPNLTPYQLDALNHKQHISLTANAGSGKTFVLARRFLSILLEENISLNNLVAITFTEKAASELYKKIADELDSRIKESNEIQAVKKLEKIRRQLVSAKISTIHSFCADLLKEFSPEAGIDANFIPIDNRVSDELITTTIEELISEVLKSGGELLNDLKKLFRLFGSRLILSKQLKYLISNRSTLDSLNKKIYCQEKAKIANDFSELFIENYQKIFENKIPTIYGQIKKINQVVQQSVKNPQLAEEIDKILGEIKNEPYKNVISLNQIFDKILTNGKIRTQNYLGKKLREEYSIEIADVEMFATEFKVFDFDENYLELEKQLAEFGVSILKIFDESLNRYEKKKLQMRYLDFEDLLLVTKDLLKREDVIGSLAVRYQYFMIDEYQDTNETQYNIFIPILDYLKRGNLFIVGDEKQSIYMFRGADLDIFNKTKSDIKNASDENSLLKLPHSFRLNPKLTLLTNKLFSRLFDNPNTIYNEVEYSELICARNTSDDGAIEFLISEKDEESDSESELIAKKIMLLKQERKCDYKDIAILSRKRKSFDEIEKIFVKYKIPYLMFGGKGFFQRQEIYDINNYLSFLVNPHNDAALIGILRSPFFSISDTELFELSLENEGSYFKKLEQISIINQKMRKVLDSLNKHLQLSKSMQISLLIRIILMDTGYWVVLSSKSNSLQYISNVEKLLNLANEFTSKGLKTLFDFVGYLEEAIRTSEDESQASLISNDNAVRLMTIHASKGLEFPTVFLVDSNSTGMDDKVRAKDVSIDKNFGILTKTPYAEDYFGDYHSAPVVCMYNYITQKRSIAELKRLLYVAVTRAENSLYITAHIKRNKDGFIKPSKGSFLSLLKDGLKIDDFSGSFHLNGNIKFMLEEDGEFINSDENISITIPVLNNLGEPSKQTIRQELVNPDEIIISTQAIPNQTKNEIISATKIAVFNQCPFKYYLIYELGYSSLHSGAVNGISEVDFSKEDKDELSANIKGSIIHKILEEEIPLNLLKEKIATLMESVVDKTKGINHDSTIDSIYKLVENYYDSEIFKRYEAYKNYNNEYEIYAKVENYFIYGIIDKVIFDGENVFILDYKTDSLSKYSSLEKLELYRPQLTFYALLISKLYPKIKQVNCSLIFIEDPKEVPTFKVDRIQLTEFEQKLNGIVNSIRKGEFKTKISHCKSCYFSDSKNECVVKH